MSTAYGSIDVATSVIALKPLGKRSGSEYQPSFFPYEPTLYTRQNLFFSSSRGYATLGRFADRRSHMTTLDRWTRIAPEFETSR